MTERDLLRESFDREMAGSDRPAFMTLSSQEYAWLYGFAAYCPSSQIDSVHDVSCPTIDSVYRCENCDLPFPRADASARFCLFCQNENL